MKPGQCIVYVLDCSGSMGEFGKLTLARAALVRTLRQQPGEVRFQVLAYNSTARQLLAGGCLAATPANIASTETALASLKSTGRSNHVEAVRVAVALRPDVIVLLTDAEDLTAVSFKAVLAGAGKPVPVCVARVSAEGIGAPRELK
jgi:Mg-chelatase subunit ChlD